MVFPVIIYGCESWTIKKAEHWRIDALNCGVEDSWEFLGLPGDPTVTRVYVPRFFVLSQQRFGVTDIKAPSACRSSQVLDRPYYSSQVWMDHVIALRQISVTALFYSEDSRKIHLRGVRAHRSKDTRRAPQRTGEREWAGFGSSIYMFVSPWACLM